MSWRTRKVLGRPWQDWLFTGAGVVFIMSLIPMLWTGAQVPVFTGLSTALMLYGLALAHMSYGNVMAVVTETVAATIWLMLGLGL